MQNICLVNKAYPKFVQYEKETTKQVLENACIGVAKQKKKDLK
jgi:hypothetical protein